MNVAAKILIEAIKAEVSRKPRTLYNNHIHPKRINKQLFELLCYEIRRPHLLAPQDREHCSINTSMGEPPSMWVWGRLIIPKVQK